MLNPAIFKALSKTIINDTFKTFRKTCAFTDILGFDYDTQTNTKKPQSVKCIVTEYSEDMIASGSAQVGDIKLIGDVANFKWAPRADTTEIVIESKLYDIKRVKEDPAGATYTMQLRARL